MIIVIADDFTGAAEMGGIGLRYGLKVEVNTEVNLQSAAELLVIATDARSMTEDDAVAEMERVTRQAARLNPSVIFKKTDSVLRGHIMAELMAQLRILNLSCALLVPANPSLGRTIINGEYLVNGQPIHTTDFANDPDFPVKTSSVNGRLYHKYIPLHIQKPSDELKCDGIIVGEVSSETDLQTWAQKANGSMLLAGAADFFSAVLVRAGCTTRDDAAEPVNWQIPALIVRGTAFKKNDDNKLTDVTSYMPADLLNSASSGNAAYAAFDIWCENIVNLIKKYDKAVIAINAELADTASINPDTVRAKMAMIVKQLFQNTPVNELLIEGGSTAFAVLKALGLTTFYPEHELATGVVRMLAADNPQLYVTIKPGSYSWPSAVQTQYFTQEKYA